MELCKKPKSKYWWFDFTVRGKRYRGSTKETNEHRAKKIAALKLAAALEGSDPLVRKAPPLRESAAQYLKSMDESQLAEKTKRYYHNGWRLLEQTPLVGNRLDQITNEAIEALRFSGSAANANNALRTLRRILNRAREKKIIREVPRIKLLEEADRARCLDQAAEEKLMPVAGQPLKDIIVLMRETGMRNVRELYRMRVENIDWDNRMIFNPDSKTRQGRRWIPISDRAFEILRDRCHGRTEGWVFPSVRKGKHISEAFVNRRWVAARTKAGLPPDLVLYCARHDFGTDLLDQTGNLKLVMKVMGHADIRSALKYQHPELERVRAVLNARHS